MPRGNPDGGEWTDGAGQSGQRVAARRPRQGGPGNLSPAQQIIRVQITAAKKQNSRISSHEQYLEPIGGSHSIGALRSYDARLNSLKIGANNRAQKIANGHGFAKHRYLPRHRQSKGQTRFSDIHSRDEYARRIYDTIVNRTHSVPLTKRRIGYYDARTNTIVVFNPFHRDGGSSYPARNGIHTYYELD
ncbi:MAG: hypothetical protein COB08_014060 [Rhodobacteraceae bacterium]|nr:hypothetical protein [Paracoccaceae bacterium]